MLTSLEPAQNRFAFKKIFAFFKCPDSFTMLKSYSFREPVNIQKLTMPTDLKVQAQLVWFKLMAKLNGLN